MMKSLLASAGLAVLASTATAADDLDATALAAIHTALDDEYHAIAVYDALIDEFGTNTAFVNIKRAEERHAAALIDLLEKYDQPVPENGYLDGSLPIAPLPDTLSEAYEDGIEGEIINIALYEDVLLPQVTEYNDITRVFTALRTASETRHLPTFTACADGTCAGGSARGEAGGEKVGQQRMARNQHGSGQGRGGRNSTSAGSGGGHGGGGNGGGGQGGGGKGGGNR